MKLKYLVTIILIMAIILGTQKTFAYTNTQSEISATIKISICGNNEVEGGEDCEPELEVNTTCSDYNLIGEKLSCDPSCQFDFSNCKTPTKIETIVNSTIAKVFKVFNPRKDNNFSRKDLGLTINKWVDSWKKYIHNLDDRDNICDLNLDTACDITDLSIILCHIDT